MFGLFEKIKQFFRKKEISRICYIDDNENMYSVPYDDANDFIKTAKEIKSDRIHKCVFAYKDAKENENVLYLTGNYDEIYRVRVEEADEFRAWQNELKCNFEKNSKTDYYE